MKRFLLCVAFLSFSCATAYDKCVKPEITAATKLAPADVAKEVAAFLICGGADLPDLAAPCAVKGLADLAVALGPGGEQAINCLIAYFEQSGDTPLVKARAKAVGAKRGVTAGDLRACGQTSNPSLEIGTRPEPPLGTAALSSSACDSKRGAMDGLSTPSGCYRWVASRTDWRASRWVALR